MLKNGLYLKADSLPHKGKFISFFYIKILKIKGDDKNEVD